MLLPVEMRDDKAANNGEVLVLGLEVIGPGYLDLGTPLIEDRNRIKIIPWEVDLLLKRRIACNSRFDPVTTDGVKA